MDPLEKLQDFGFNYALLVHTPTAREAVPMWVLPRPRFVLNRYMKPKGFTLNKKKHVLGHFASSRVTLGERCWVHSTLFFNNPGPKMFKLSKIELIYKAKKFKVPPFTI